MHSHSHIEKELRGLNMDIAKMSASKSSVLFFFFSFPSCFKCVIFKKLFIFLSGRSNRVWTTEDEQELELVYQENKETDGTVGLLFLFSSCSIVWSVTRLNGVFIPVFQSQFKALQNRKPWSLLPLGDNSSMSEVYPVGYMHWWALRLFTGGRSKCMISVEVIKYFWLRGVWETWPGSW